MQLTFLQGGNRGDTSGDIPIPVYLCDSESDLKIGLELAERLSARHLILQHALGRCIFVRHALLSVTLLCPSRSIVRHSVTLFCPSRSSTHARKDGGGVTHAMDGGGERVH